MWLHSQDAHIQMGKQDTGSRAIKNVVMINWLVQEKKMGICRRNSGNLD